MRFMYEIFQSLSTLKTTMKKIKNNINGLNIFAFQIILPGLPFPKNGETNFGAFFNEITKKHARNIENEF